MIFSNICIVIGFSSIYITLFRQNINNFSQPLNVIDTIYFSFVTYTTVGYGDIYPQLQLAKITVIMEIMFSLFMLIIIIGAATSRIITNERKRHEEYIKNREKEMKTRETIMKTAGIGLYGNYDEIFKEAQHRIKTKK